MPPALKFYARNSTWILIVKIASYPLLNLFLTIKNFHVRNHAAHQLAYITTNSPLKLIHQYNKFP